MYEHGAIWSLVGADGTIVNFNDGASGLVLEEASGFDSPSIRTSVEALPEADGAVAGDSWLGPRSVTLRGKVGVNLTAAQRNLVVVNLQAAARGLRSDCTLKAQASGLPAMQAKGRLEGIRVGPGFLKEFLLSFVCPDPRIYSQALNVLSANASGSGSTPGAAFPWAFPVSFGGGGGATASLSVGNAGNFLTPPLARATGPLNGAQFTNATTGESLYVDGVSLNAGEWLEVDFSAHTVVKSDGSNLYHKVRFPGSVWWHLQKGGNTVELWVNSGATTATQLQVTWRDAWL